MEENFVFLIAISDYEIDLVCQRLKEAGIRYLVRDSTANAWQRQYGGVGLMGKEILVRASELIRAKELLGIKDKEPPFYHGRKENFIWKLIGGVAVIFAGISIIGNFLFTPKLFQKFAKLFPIIFSKKLFIILFLVSIVLAGGVFAWQHFGAPKVEKIQVGAIEGSLGYPSDFIPSDMKVCAESITTGEEYCTEDHIKNSKYTYGEGYKIEVPAGDYYVFAALPSWGDYKAYYSEFVICGLRAECPSHKSISIKVVGSELVGGIDPLDWYKPREEIKNETADWKTYKDEEYGFEVKYPLDKMLYKDIYEFNFYKNPIYKGIKIGELEFGCSPHIYPNIDDNFLFLLDEFKKENKEPLYPLYKVIESETGKKYYFGFSIASHAVSIDSCEPIFNQMLSTFKFLK